MNVGSVNSFVSSQEREIDPEDSSRDDYKIEEDINSAYVMSTTDINNWNFIAGLRYESTDFTANGFKFDAEEETVEATNFKNNYDHWLPAIHVRYRFNDNTIARAAWTNSVVRPTFEQLSPGEVDDDGEIDKGNPDLDPLESMNFDFGIEHYMGSAGVISAFVFYKDIEDFIYEIYYEDEGLEITTFENGNSADLYGIELAYSKQFTELPTPWNGLIFSANATYTDSDAEIEYNGTKRDIRLPGQSDLTSNVMIGYETADFGIRLAANHKSDYLDEVGEGDTDQGDLYEDNHTQIDLTANYFITESLQVNFQGINLTDEPFYKFQKSKKYNAQYEEYGPTYKLGIVYSNF